MIKVEINKRDLAELQRDLHVLRPKNLLRSEMEPFATSVIQEAGRYPPPVGYPRTGHLKRSWYYTIHGVNAEIKNAASYAGWVHGEEQIDTHKKHGWKQVFDVATTQLEKMLDRLSKKVDKIWKS